MSDKHTPGPWHANGLQVKADSFTEIATVYGPQPLPEREANARLIAAVLELLEVARKIVEAAESKLLSERHRVVDMARSAIAKAEGREG
jgi:hypothetical protein